MELVRLEPLFSIVAILPIVCQCHFGNWLRTGSFLPILFVLLLVLLDTAALRGLRTSAAWI